ncbi:hypothetical protein ACLB2K_067125 [Fragaria x ananassa]
MDPNEHEFLLTTDPGNGHNFKFSIGTPPSEIYAIADTGSTLIWTQCKPCKTNFKTKRPMFDPSKSSTYRNITCREKECRFVDDMKSVDDSPDFCTKNPARSCPYGVTYAGATSTEGVLAKETFTLTSTTSKTVTLKDVVFGCGDFQEDRDGSTTDYDMGVVGLGRGPLSFVSQIAPYVGGNKFSHCLVPLDTDPKIQSKINFGNGSEVTGEGVVSTPLVKLESYKYNYGVVAQGITIGDKFVPYSLNVTSPNKQHMMVDSGSTFTLVPYEFFDRITTELKKRLDPKLKPFIAKDAKNTALCLNSTTVPKEPKMTFHFNGGGKLPLVTEKMFIKDEENENKLCFGIMHFDDGCNVGVYGAVMQGNITTKKWFLGDEKKKTGR